MIVEELQKEQELIEEDIDRFCSDIKSEFGPIYDGVGDIKKYLECKPRICWVLKEPYVKGDDKGGWSLTGDYLNQEDRYPDIIESRPWKTWGPVTRATYGILNNMPYSEIDKKDNLEMIHCLKQIAVIEISKMPGKTKSKDSDLAQKYEYWKPILFRQLKQYDPQIIIFGYTFQHFQKDLEIRDEELTQHEHDIRYVVKNGKLYVDAYHPAQWQIPPTEYVQGIIDVVKMNENSIK
jgi:hypothetical protein